MARKARFTALVLFETVSLVVILIVLAILGLYEHPLL